MKGLEIINHVVRAKMPDREQVKVNCLNQAVAETHRAKRPILRHSAFAFATAAVLVTCVMFGNMLLKPTIDKDNAFTLKAYAMERQTGGFVELRELDLLGETYYYWGAYNEGSVFYANANFRCEGENIKSVDLYVNEGFFAKQYYKILSGVIDWVESDSGGYRVAVAVDDEEYTFLVDDEYAAAAYGDDVELLGSSIAFSYFDRTELLGSSITLDQDSMRDDFYLVLGTEVADSRERPTQVTVRAVAAFNDGTQQEEVFTLSIE